MKTISLILLAIFGSSVLGNPRPGFGPGLQDWGYISPRNGAHLFYWLHYTLAKVARFDERPLIITFEGGPGSASSGVSNLAESGPIDMDLKIRTDSWVHSYNVLYIDNPVGVGYSYVDSEDLLVKTDEEFAADTLEFLKQFFARDSGVQKSPVFFVGSSYAGKMIPLIAVALEEAIKNKEISMDFRGIALGNPAISGVDSMEAYAPFLLQMGLIDDRGFEKITTSVSKVISFMNENEWSKAMEFWNTDTAVLLNQESGGMSIHNVLLPQKTEFSEQLRSLMNGLVKQTLGLNATWSSYSEKVLEVLSEEIFKPVDHLIPLLLDETDLKVIVYSGHLDLIVSHPGTVAWIKRMVWSGEEEFWNAERIYVKNDGLIDAQLRNFKNFYLYTVIRAGHHVATDNRNAMKYILEEMTGF